MISIPKHFLTGAEHYLLRLESWNNKQKPEEFRLFCTYGAEDDKLWTLCINIVWEPRRFIQPKRYKRVDGVIVSIYCKDFKKSIAAGYQPEFLKTRLFSRKGTREKFAGNYSKNSTKAHGSNARYFNLNGVPDSSPKGPRPYGVIQPKRYKLETFCNWTIIHPGILKHPCQKL